jgi:thioredoxin 1
MKELNEKQFNKEISKGFIAVLFYNNFAGPCLEFFPIFEAAEKKYPKMKFAKLDIEKYAKVAAKYIDVDREIPSTIFFKEGDEVDRILGSCSEYALNAKIDDVLVIKK